MDKSLYDVEAVNEKLKSMKSLEDLTGKDGVIQMMIKSTVERILKAEQQAHLGYDPYQKKDKEIQNSRNGYSKKTMRTSSGQMEIDIPRDREGTFDPQFIKKHQSFDPDLEKRVVSLYAKGMTVRDIGCHLKDFYGAEVSAPLISKITDSVMDLVREWQSRPLERVYAVVFMDAIFYKARHDNKVISKAAYTCLGIDLEGKSDILGIWIAESEGSHFWLNILTELKSRGVEDILIACVDGLRGFSEAIATIFPQAQIQQCIIHQIRHSLRYVGSKHQKEFMVDLKTVYKAPSLQSAQDGMEKLSEKWNERYPVVISSWRNNWTHLSTFFNFPQEIRKMIYTTNAVEGVHRQFRKVTKSKTIFPTDDSLLKMLYLASQDACKKMRAKQNWALMIGQLKVIFGERVPLDLR